MASFGLAIGRPAVVPPEHEHFDVGADFAIEAPSTTRDANPDLARRDNGESINAAWVRASFGFAPAHPTVMPSAHDSFDDRSENEILEEPSADGDVQPSVIFGDCDSAVPASLGNGRSRADATGSSVSNQFDAPCDSANVKIDRRSSPLQAKEKKQQNGTPSSAVHTDITRPWCLDNLMALSGFFTHKQSPEIEDVERWCTMAGQRDFKVALLILGLDWLLSSALSSVGLLFALLYRDAFDWAGNFDTCVVFGVIGAIFSGWNIAQYASYAIQTTGHVTIVQLQSALRHLAPLLLPSNLLGWSACALTSLTSLKSAPLVYKLVLICAPPIISGIASKTHYKLQYLLGHATSDQRDQRTDALATRLSNEARAAAQKIECPFATISAKVFLKNFLGPCTCSMWTVAYVIVLRGGHILANDLEEGFKPYAQVCLFAFSLMVMAAGMALLRDWILRSNGYYGYNGQMIMAFMLIYNLVSDVQVRLGLIKMSGSLRLVCAGIHPLYFAILRLRVKNAYLQDRSFRENAATEVRTSRNLPNLSANKEPLMVIMMMASLVTQNVSAVVLAGLACLYQDVPMFSLGTCSRDGFWYQILQDSLLTWVGDTVTIIYYAYRRVPVLYFFSLLDPFLTLTAIIVVYLCVMLALMTGAMQF